ncbi:MAG: hypothetical protein J6W64_05710 [Bacilli bacterium]|nr:hypothetical protein [Bacilli bacterium]
MPNETLTLLGQIFEVCIIPLLGILVPFVIQWIRTKTATLAENANNETAKKYIEMLTDTVTNAVIAVNQTYVDALKGKNAFTAEAQQEAFTMAYTAVLNNLTDEAKIYLNEIYGDLESYIKVLIEAKVRENK